MIKKFIVWYLERKSHCFFRYKSKVVRMFSEAWYDEHIKNIGWGKVKDLNIILKLLEECVEEIENLYGKETELTERVRDYVSK